MFHFHLIYHAETEHWWESIVYNSIYYLSDLMIKNIVEYVFTFLFRGFWTASHL